MVQQLFSILFQHRAGISKKYCFDMLSDFSNEETINLVWDHLIEGNFIMSERDSYFPSTHIMDLSEKGTIHSNIPDSGTMKVICDNREIGSVFTPIDKVFLLNGRVWQIISVARGKIYVKPSSAKVIKAPSSRVSDYGFFYKYLPAGLKRTADAK